MDISVSNRSELIDAIERANMEPYEQHVIHLNDGDYIFEDGPYMMFDRNALPIIRSNITINGNGQTLVREDSAPQFRFLTVEDRRVRLTVNNLNFRGGDSGQSGGGAIANTGRLILSNCRFIHNLGTLGGAIFNGDHCEMVAASCIFEMNTAIARGGAVYSSAAQLTIVLSRFADNVVTTGVHNDIELYLPSATVLKENNFGHGVVVVHPHRDGIYPYMGY